MDEQAHKINAELEAIEKEIFTLAKQYRVYAAKAVKARNNYDIEKDKQLLAVRLKCELEGIKANADEKTAMAKENYAEFMIAARESETMLDCCQKDIQSANARLSSIQTRARLLKTEADLTNYR